MSTFGHIHWQEGLFLQPHHLQVMQRFLLERIRSDRRLAWPYSWGVVDAELSTEALKNNRVQFSRLHVVMRSGVEVVVPDGADLAPLDITEKFAASSQPFRVCLGIPQWHASRANAIDEGGDVRKKSLYRVRSTETADENTGTNPQLLPLRRVNAKLMFEDDDPTEMEMLPLVRVVHGTGEKADGLPAVDPRYFPPCLLMRGSLELMQICRGIANLVEATRKEIVTLINNHGAFDVQNLQGPTLEQVMRLRILNRFSSRLWAMLEAPAMSPFEVYLELHELLGELAALAPDRDAEVFEIFKYQHDEPAVVFMNLNERIRLLLKAKASSSVRKIAFQQLPGYMTASLTPEECNDATDIFLGVKTKEEFSSFRDLFIEGVRVKLMPAKQWNLLVPGVKLEWEHDPPAVMQPDLRYFRLVRSGEKWEQAKQEGRLAFRWVGKDLSSWDVALYLIMPLQEGKKRS